MAAAWAAAELAGENDAAAAVEDLRRPEEELWRRSPAEVDDSATEAWRVGDGCGNLTGD